MNSIIKGKITSVFGDDINTDDIIRADVLQESTDKDFFAKYAFEKFDNNFIQRCQKNSSNIIIGGENFGCGSSREQAVYALSGNNVKAVIAQSYPDIFYRNSINNGLVLIKFKQASTLSLDSNVRIDLDEKKIIVDDQEFDFECSNDDLLTMKKGGRLGLVKHYIDDKHIHINKKIDCENRKGQTIVEKIVSNHVGETVHAGDNVSALPIDFIYLNEVIAPASIKYYKNDFGDNSKVFDNSKVSLIPDHSIPSCSIEVSKGIDRMKEFSHEQGIKMYKQGRGIEHIVFMEEGKILPGSIVLGTDSHTCSNGALNCLSFGVGTTDSEYAMASGALFNFTVPETIKVVLNGKMQKGVSSKDIVLSILGKIGSKGASKKILEYSGPALSDMSIDARSTISNMSVEMSARSGIFPFDDTVKDYLGNKHYSPTVSDNDAVFSEVIEINLDELEPSVAFPHSPDNVTSVSSIDNKITESQEINSSVFPAITKEDIKITEAFIGACTNGKLEDLRVAASILKGHKIAETVDLIIVPASDQIFKQALSNGYIETFLEAGAMIEAPNCGPCFGKHLGVASDKARILSSSNRNFKGRMGHKDSLIFLASPATVAASAIEGVICDPRKYL